MSKIFSRCGSEVILGYLSIARDHTGNPATRNIFISYEHKAYKIG